MNRTGTNLEISSSRLYHLEMASSASSEAPRRPLDTPKCVCGPNLAQGWHRIRSQQNAPIAAPHAAMVVKLPGNEISGSVITGNYQELPW
jgi:hypothetical protein